MPWLDIIGVVVIDSNPFDFSMVACWSLQLFSCRIKPSPHSCMSDSFQKKLLFTSNIFLKNSPKYGHFCQNYIEVISYWADTRIGLATFCPFSSAVRSHYWTSQVGHLQLYYLLSHALSSRVLSNCCLMWNSNYTKCLQISGHNEKLCFLHVLISCDKSVSFCS